ncbi:MAG: hypothetical protein QUS11_07315 [Candidatus Fermentibacter sp.]|nr:hypothetical protein [Candidatus Fermentibacter sp.]
MRAWQHEKPLLVYMLLPPLVMTAVGLALPGDLRSDQGTPVGSALAICGGVWFLAAVPVVLILAGRDAGVDNPAGGGGKRGDDHPDP